ncbi:alpha-(1-_3)-arabinofuranosyltransferase domain-containing protein [Streptomyces oceani]|uniref:alpha-(1->3)-arabinofuranosyltransferase domain-containing protein n=1 Tax=Streptomyces oceani TaxID=1075402 RepID=UPI000871BDB0|nr:alpha-(1->3)-arabinofuranosyltransferase family protein [Streptomyces oceani]
MTTSALSPPAPAGPGRPQHARTTSKPPPEGERRGRRWLLGFWLTVFVATLAAAPGKVTFDTKLGVFTDPWRFLGELTGLWQDQAGFGGIADQYVGYAFPMLPYYALTDLLQIPIWLAERLWLSLIVTAAFWGALRLAERFGVGSARSRLLGAAAYALWPTFTIVIGSTSAAALPGAMLPWVLLPLTSTTASPRVAAARSALLIPFMGGVNAASTLASLLPVGLYVLSRTGRKRRTLIAWWTPGVLLATLWWVVPLLLLGMYGEDFMPYVEQADTTTGTMSATEMLRGAGNWTAYLNYGEPWLPAGWAMATGVLAILGSATAAAVGLAGLARRDLPERRWLVLTAITVTGIMLAGYAGGLGGPLAETVQGWLDGTLRPFRNIYKFQPGLALALALGLAHVVGRLSTAPTGAAGRDGGSGPGDGAPAGGGRTAGPRRFLPALLALLVLPGLAVPYLKGDILQSGAYEKLPKHWEQTADWLEKNSPDTRAYVTPATSHGIYDWGSPIDQPLHALAESPWAQRDFVPFGTPGNRRALDAVEQALKSGGEVPGLSEFLGRAGLYNVVVRNDLDPDQVGYVPPQTVKRTLEASGYEKVTAFGPKVTTGTIPANTPVDIVGLYPRPQSVEIYQPTDVPRPKEVTAKPVSETTVVSGGPEALLPLADDPAVTGRPTVLAGDAHPGLSKPETRVQADGLRRADTRFGLLTNNTSATYGPTERNDPDSVQDPGEKPKQILPSEGTEHQTTATLRGAESVTASSSGNWLFHLPQFEPVGAFDGNPDTAWAEGSAGESEGQWVRVGFDEPTKIPKKLTVTPLPGEQVRAVPTSVRVETDQGSRESPLQPDASSQEIRAPEGEAEWLKLTITGTEDGRAGLSGAGFSEISIPDVQVTKLLRLPEDAGSDPVEGEVISLNRASDPGGLSEVSAEEGLHRRFDTAGSDDFAIQAKALPVPGTELDNLLDEVAPGSRDRLTATADSTSRFSTQTSPRSLVDKNLTTSWVAGGDPTIHLRWPEKKKITEMVLAGAGGITARPTEVRISSDDGAVTTSVDENGWARFGEMETDSLDITVTETEQKTVHNPFAEEQMQLPVGLSEVHIPALDELRAAAPDPDKEFELSCGSGPVLAVDGKLHATKASGKVSDLTEGRPVDVELCAGKARDGTLSLNSGQHTVEAGGVGPLAISQLRLGRGDAVQAGSETEAGGGDAVRTQRSASERAEGRDVTATDWTGDDRTIRVGAGDASYLQTHQNVNDGWKATLNGEELTPLRLDGWQQGFLVPAGEGGVITLEYEPAGWYTGSLVAGGFGLLALLGLAFVRRRSGTPLGAQDRAYDGAYDDGEHGRCGPGAPPRPSWVLGTVVVTAVFALVTGPYALIVPLLALLARFRPAPLAPLALLAMLGAGVTAAVGAATADSGIPVDEGAFGRVAQALALLALAAALVTAPVRERDDTAEDSAADAEGDDGPGRGGAGFGPRPYEFDEPATSQLPVLPGQAVPAPGGTREQAPLPQRHPEAGTEPPAGQTRQLPQQPPPSGSQRQAPPQHPTPQHPPRTRPAPPPPAPPRRGEEPGR